MKLKEYETLRKLMQQTTSDNDHEALSALRMANAILKKHNITWELVFKRTVTVVNEFEPDPEAVDPAASQRAEDARQIDAAFATVEESDPRGTFADFISSLKTQWETKRHLSLPQKDALFKAARRVQSERKR